MIHKRMRMGEIRVVEEVSAWIEEARKRFCRG
jgi:hypothetical protein